MTRAAFVDELIGQAKKSFGGYWASLPDEQRLRLGGMEEELRGIVRELEGGLWDLLAAKLNELAIELSGQCDCGRRCEHRKDSVKLDVLGHRVQFPCTYLYCRACKRGISPVRRWFGLEHGGVSLAFERAMADLTTRMTFGDAVVSMKEHHEQQVDRTKAQRVTYQVGLQAQEYLQERRHSARNEVCNLAREGVEQLLFTADGGAIPIGMLTRPTTAQAQAKAPKTEIRKLPKGTRSIVGREARFISVHAARPDAQRVVDCHIAPYDNTRYTGERMYAAAAEAGLTDRSRIHGVFDMGKWIHTQFQEQFFAYDRSACADIMHVAEYLIDAGRVMVGPEQAKGWGMERKRRLLAGHYDQVLAELAGHQCQSNCAKSESSDKCLVRVAQTYLENNGQYMKDYEDFMVRGLPVGSGEAESGIRHVIKRRMAVAGAWEQNNAPLMLALLSIRASGWWDDFWRWRQQRDRQAWTDRQQGTFKVLSRRYRNNPQALRAA